MGLPILTDRTIQAFNWMLIHSLWQGLIIAVIAAVVLLLTKKHSAAIRYNMVLILFSAFILTAFSTFFYELDNSRIIPVPAVSAAANNPVLASASHQTVSVVRIMSNYCSSHSFVIVMMWFVLFILKAASMTIGMLYIYRARNYQIFSAPEYWREQVASLCEKLKIKRSVQLFESAYVKMPVVTGYLKPVILIPAGLIAGLPAAQVEAILLHELAHIRRNDYAVNFMQNIAEAIFFFNPGLLWISSLLREEREHCCDDIAIAQTNSREEFVQALISFKEYSAAPVLAVAFAGQKSSVINRVMRIVYQENKSFSKKEKGFFMAGIVAILFIGFTIAQIKKSEPVKKHLAAISKQIKTEIGSLSEQVTANNKEIKKPVRHVEETPVQEVSLSRTWTEHNQKWQIIWASQRDAFRESNAKWDALWRAHNQKWETVWRERSTNSRSINAKWDSIWRAHNQKWDAIWRKLNMVMSENTKKWDAKRRELNGKWDAVWVEENKKTRANTPKWDSIWAKHNQKWDAIWAEQNSKAAVDTKKWDAKWTEHNDKWSATWVKFYKEWDQVWIENDKKQISDSKLRRLQSKQQTETENLRAIQRSEADLLRRQQSVETNASRSQQSSSTGGLRSVQSTEASELRARQAAEYRMSGNQTNSETAKLKAAQAAEVAAFKLEQTKETNTLKLQQDSERARLQAEQRIESDQLKAKQASESSQFKTLQNTETSGLKAQESQEAANMKAQQALETDNLKVKQKENEDKLRVQQKLEETKLRAVLSRSDNADQPPATTQDLNNHSIKNHNDTKNHNSKSQHQQQESKIIKG